MDCITISSDEEDIQVLNVKLAPPLEKKIETSENKIIPVIQIVEKDPVKQTVQPCQVDRKPSINGFSATSQAVPVINLVDDDEDNDSCEVKSEQKRAVLRPRNNIPLRRTERAHSSNTAEKLKNGCQDTSGNKVKYSGNGSSKKKKSSKVSGSKGGKQSMNGESEKNKEPVVTYSNEHLVEKLIETCKKVEYGKDMDIVEKRIWNYFTSASTSKTQSLEFKTYLENAISKIENILNSTKDKFMISRVIKDFINEMKSDPSVVTGKLRQLYCVYEKLVKKITQLEDTEVETDDESGNPYIYLDRYRRKAVVVYNKICELEGRATDADRPTLQRFFFTGSSAPVPVQRAMERFYNKTQRFPDFYDVKKVVTYVNKKEKLGLMEKEAFKIAQQVFIEFGERLVCRRKYDDYNILVDYLKEGQCIDPADLDTELQMKLDENKRTRKKEHEVLESYAMQDACNSKKDERSESRTEENIGKDDNDIEETTINVSSSSSASSLASSPASSDDEVSEVGSDESDDENSEQPAKQSNTLFSDSEEELTVIELVDKRKKLESNRLSSKRFKTDEDPTSESESTKALVNRDTV